jgi:hypothetical protein
MTKKLCAAKSLVPDSFTLAATVWTVKRIPEFADLGRCERDKATIFIREGMPPQVEETTFLHELVHAIKFMQGIDSEKHDEQDIDAFAHFLHQYLKGR